MEGIEQLHRDVDVVKMGGVYILEGIQEIIAEMYQNQDLDYVGLIRDNRLSTKVEKTKKQQKDSKSKRFSCEQPQKRFLSTLLHFGNCCRTQAGMQKIISTKGLIKLTGYRKKSDSNLTNTIFK